MVERETSSVKSVHSGSSAGSSTTAANSVSGRGATASPSLEASQSSSAKTSRSQSILSVFSLGAGKRASAATPTPTAAPTTASTTAAPSTSTHSNSHSNAHRHVEDDIPEIKSLGDDFRREVENELQQHRQHQNTTDSCSSSKTLANNFKSLSVQDKGKSMSFVSLSVKVF